MTTPDDETLFARLQALAADGRARRAGRDDESRPAGGGRPRGRGWSSVLTIGGRHVAVVVAVLLLGLAGASWAVLRARALPPAPLTPSAVARSDGHRPTPPASSALPGPASTAASPQLIVAHVAGAVVRPGIVRLPPGARVADALAAAGGLTTDADAAELNLAAPVADGSQILVGTRAEPRGEVHSPALPASASGVPPSAGGAPAGVPVNLNTATVEQLDGLPGVGPVTAQKIVAWRAQHGRFNRVEELAEVDGIGPKTFAQIAPHVSV